MPERRPVSTMNPATRVDQQLAPRRGDEVGIQFDGHAAGRAAVRRVDSRPARRAAPAGAGAQPHPTLRLRLGREPHDGGHDGGRRAQRPTRSTCSTPFCSAHTTVRSSHSRASQPAASSFWVSFTASSTTSTGPADLSGIGVHRPRHHDRIPVVGPELDGVARACRPHTARDARPRAGMPRSSSRWRPGRPRNAGRQHMVFAQALIHERQTTGGFAPTTLWQSSRQAFPREILCCAAMPPVRCGPPTPVRR